MSDAALVAAATQPSHGSAAAARLWALAALWVTLVWAAAAIAWPLAGETVPWDAKNHFYPMFRYLGEAFEAGVIPFWNPYHYGGHPTAADPQSLLFTPTLALFAFAHPHASMTAFDVAVFAHLLIGGLATLGLFARRGLRPEGAALAAVMVMLGGVAASRLQHTGMIVSYGLIPLALLAFERFLDDARWRSAVLAGLAAGLMALGRDQIAFFGCMILIGAAANGLILAERRLVWVRARLGGMVLSGLIAALIVAPPALLTLQFLAYSNRPGVGYGLAAMGSLPPHAVATLFFPNVFGTLDRSVNYWGPGPMTILGGSWTDMSINYLFLGTIPAALLIVHGIAGGRLFAREVRFLVVMLVLAALYAFGRFTPAFELAFDLIPGVSLYRRPADAAFIMGFALAMLAGYVLHRLIVDASPDLHGRSPAAALRALAAAGFGVTLIAVALSFAIPVNRLAYALTEIAFGLGLAGLGLWLAARPGSVATRARIAVLLVGVTGAELVWRHAASDINGEPLSAYSALGPLKPGEREGLAILKRHIAENTTAKRRPRVEILGPVSGWQNAAMLHRLEDTLGYNALRIADYAEATGSGENAADLSLRQFPGTFRGWRSRLASLLGLEYLVLDRPIERMPPSYPRPETIEPLFAAPGFHVYRLGPAAPRVYVANHLIPVDARAVIDGEELPEFNRASAALIDEASLGALRGDYGVRDTTTEPSPPTAFARIAAYKRNRVLIEVETDRPSVLVLHDLHYPGWEAFVDGVPTPILKVNLLFRGVETPQGRHIVEFRYKPLTAANLLAAARSALNRSDAH